MPRNQYDPKVAKVLPGHDSPDNAYSVPDWPYGRFRTEMRHWIETTKHGQRHVSMSLNPKTNRYNKPHVGTYCLIMVLYLDDVGHIHADGISEGTGEEDFNAFMEIFGPYLDEHQQKVAEDYRRAHEVYWAKWRAR